MIVHRDGKWCVVSKDGEKSFGCFDTEDAAQKRLGQIEHFKGEARDMAEATVTLEAMREICPACADEMTSLGVVAVKVSTLAESDTFLRHADFARLKRPATARRESIRCRFLEAAPEDIQGRVWEVVLIEAGTSANGFTYTVDALRQAVTAGLFEGVPAHLIEFDSAVASRFKDHFPEGMESRKFGRTVIGKFTDAKFDESRKAVTARFHFFDEQMRKLNLEAFRVDGKPLFEFSINGEGSILESGGRLNVEMLTVMKSVDAVSNAAAGGRFLRAVASMGTGSANKTGGRMDWHQLALALIRECASNLLEGKSVEGLTAKDLRSMLETLAGQESMKASAGFIRNVAENLKDKATVPPADIATAQAELAKATEAAKKASAEFAAETAKLAESRHKAAVETAIKDAKIDGDLAEMVRDLASAKPNDAAHLTGVVDRAKKLAEAKGWNEPKLTGTVSVGTEERDRIGAAIGAAIKGEPFAVLESNGAKDRVGAIRSIREAFGILTGDVNPDPKAMLSVIATAIREAGARYNAYSAPAAYRPSMARVEEQAKVARATLTEGLRSRRRIRESVDTTTFATIFADTLYRQLIADYDLPQMNDWRQVVSVFHTALDDRTQRFNRLGQYEELPTVAEGAPYNPAVTPQDEEVSVTPIKRGYTEDLTVEAILRDDLRATAQIPLRLMRAAMQTRRRSIWDPIIANDLVFDGVALFAAGHGANNGAAAFTHDALDARRAVRRRQTAFNGAFHELGEGNVPRFILFGPELEGLIKETVASQTNPQANLPAGVANVHSGIVPISLDFATVTATFWATIADPRRVPTVAFVTVRGWEEPKMAVNDQENVGPMFEEDRAVTKISDFFEPVILDWRGYDRGNA